VPYCPLQRREAALAIRPAVDAALEMKVAIKKKKEDFCHLKSSGYLMSEWIVEQISSTNATGACRALEFCCFAESNRC
jgi:hypothetical protein